MTGRWLAALASPEVMRRIGAVFLMFAVYLVGLRIPVPGVDREALARLIEAVGPGAMPFLDLFSGGAFRTLTLFALGLTPYINASILMQMLTFLSPRLAEIAKEGEPGRKRITRYTHRLTLLFAVIESVVLLVMLAGWGSKTPWWASVSIVGTLCAGTALLVAMGEWITRRGVGQGISLLIAGSILAGLPHQIARLREGFSLEPGALIGPFELARLVLLFLATLIGIIVVTQATRRVPIEHARRGGSSLPAERSFLPFGLNGAGVLPLFFALSVLEMGSGLLSRLPHGLGTAWGQVEGYVAPLLFAGLILLFASLTAAMQTRVPDLAENLQKSGAYIPGIRPGRSTEAFLDRTQRRLALAGGLFLAALGLLQFATHAITGVPPSHFSLVGGTSLLIVVGVALETLRSLEAHMSMQGYRGFIRARAATAPVATIGFPAPR